MMSTYLHVVVSAALALSARGEPVCEGTACAAETQAMLQRTSPTQKEATGLTEDRASVQPMWTMYAQGARCEEGVGKGFVVVNEDACAAKAEALSFAYYSYRHYADERECTVVETCTIKNKQDWITKIKVPISWGVYANDKKCLGVATRVHSEAMCARAAASAGHTYYSYRAYDEKCLTTATCQEQGGAGAKYFKIKMRGGAPWTDKELSAIRATMFEIFSWKKSTHLLELCEYYKGQEYPCILERFEYTDPSERFVSCDSQHRSKRAYRETMSCSDGNGSEVTLAMPPGALPTAPRFLRLGFHDCLKYENGTGGCDGCLNFKGMFIMKNMLEESSQEGRRRSKLTYDITEGDNNNLAATADVLERIYTDHTYGEQARFLTRSLKDSGKSRADLWAYVTLLSAEYFMLKNNERCQSDSPRHLYNYLPNNTLSHPCNITRARPFTFHTGRRDCPEYDKPSTRQREYQTGKTEIQVNPHWSGKEVVQWFHKNFDFTGRETVAIMGAHTAGGYDARTSTFRYTWTGVELAQADLLNNVYYRILAYKPVYLYADLPVVAKAQADGATVPAPREIGWKLNPRHLTPSKGPVQWFMKTYPAAGSGLTRHIGTDLHAVMINTDIGLFLDFDTTAGGFPIRNGSHEHCSKLATRVSSNRPTLDSRDAQACLQTMADSTGKALHEIVEEYADNQDLWWNDFTNALERMLTNGYSLHDLVAQKVATAPSTTAGH